MSEKNELRTCSLSLPTDIFRKIDDLADAERRATGGFVSRSSMASRLLSEAIAAREAAAT